MLNPGDLTLLSFNGIERVARFERDEGELSVLAIFMKAHTLTVYAPKFWLHNIESLSIPACVSGNIFKKVTQYKFERLE